MSIAYQTDPVSKVEFTVVGSRKVVKEQFSKDGSNMKGVIYHYPEVQSSAEAIEYLGGEDVVVDLLNGALKAAVRARVTNKFNSNFPAGVDESSRVQQAAYLQKFVENPVIFSVEDALSYQPGTRELSLNGLTKKFNATLTEFTELLKIGKFEEAQEKNKELTAIGSKLQSVLAEQQADALRAATAAAASVNA